MTQIVLPFRPQAGDPEDISQIMADFDAITAVVNGDIRGDNINAAAAIAVAKLAGGSAGAKLETLGSVPTWMKLCKAKGHRTSTQSFAHAATVALALQVEDFDTDNILDVAGGTPSRMVIKTAGTYQCDGYLSWAPAGAGPRIAFLKKNGVDFNICEVPACSAPDQTQCSVAGSIDCQVNDYIEIYGYQTSGGGSASAGGWLTVYRMGA